MVGALSCVFTSGRTCNTSCVPAGSAISQAAASIASEELKGMELQEVGTLDADWMIELLGIPVSATRRKCALLNLKVVRGAVTGDDSWPTGSA